LGAHPRNFLIQLLRDLDEAPPIDLPIPLQLPQLTSELKECTHDILCFVFVQSVWTLGCASIAAMEEFEPPGEFGVLLVVEAIDILEIPIKGKEECYTKG
jgi:hypothetical protein